MMWTYSCSLIPVRRGDTFFDVQTGQVVTHCVERDLYAKRALQTGDSNRGILTDGIQSDPHNDEKLSGSAPQRQHVMLLTVSPANQKRATQ
jgi:hypothetical protein